MIKISANVSKKVPLPGVDYSSQQFGAAMEIEVSDADKPEAVQARLKGLYALLANTIDQQITEAGQPIARTSVQPPLPMPQRQITAPMQPAAPLPANGFQRAVPANGKNGRTVYASPPQQRAIHGICKNLNLDVASVLANYNVTDVSQLTIKDASRLIDQLKQLQNGNGTPTQQ